MWEQCGFHRTRKDDNEDHDQEKVKVSLDEDLERVSSTVEEGDISSSITENLIINTRENDQEMHIPYELEI